MILYLSFFFLLSRIKSTSLSFRLRHRRLAYPNDITNVSWIKTLGRLKDPLEVVGKSLVKRFQ